MASNLMAMASNLIVMASKRIAMASNLFGLANRLDSFCFDLEGNGEPRAVDGKELAASFALAVNAFVQHYWTCLKDYEVTLDHQVEGSGHVALEERQQTFEGLRHLRGFVVFLTRSKPCLVYSLYGCREPLGHKQRLLFVVQSCSGTCSVYKCSTEYSIIYHYTTCASGNATAAGNDAQMAR